MRIVFLGQRGMPVFGRQGASAAERPAFAKATAGMPTSDGEACQYGGQTRCAERRVEGVSTVLAAAGHAVYATCARPFVPRVMHSFAGVRLLHRWSPPLVRSDSWLHALQEVLMLWRLDPQAVHLHGWQQAALLPLMRYVVPSAALVLTIETLPVRGWQRLALQRAAGLADALTVPTRALQAALLHQFGVRAQYVPDGYAPRAVPGIPLRSFGVRRGQRYFVAQAHTTASLRTLAGAWERARLRSRVLVLAERGPRARVWERRYPCLRFVGELSGRRLATALEHSAGALLLEPAQSRMLLLQAMHAGLPIIAVADGLLQETAGVTARFVRTGNMGDLTEVVHGVFSSPARRRYLGSRARRRAQAHFTWERIAEDYLTLYAARVARLVPLDSVRASFAQAQAGR